MGILIYSPKLDDHGNSVKGLAFCERLLSQAFKKMTAVGFEPTPPERPRPERGALDHSAKLSVGQFPMIFSHFLKTLSVFSTSIISIPFNIPAKKLIQEDTCLSQSKPIL